MPIQWGDVPTWAGAVGTIAAVLWAVYLYRGSLLDKKMSQARLLSPMGARTFIQMQPGEQLLGVPTLLEAGVKTNQGRSLEQFAWRTQVRLVSTSDEAFYGVSLAVIRHDGEVISIPIDTSELGPHESCSWMVYLHKPAEDPMHVRVRFTDASGARWERTNREPLKAIPSERW
jgi:hypothetical protein